MKIFIAYWKNIFNYKSKSSKKEFLLVIVFNIIIAIILGVLGGILSEILSNKELCFGASAIKQNAVWKKVLSIAENVQICPAKS